MCSWSVRGDLCNGQNGQSQEIATTGTNPAVFSSRGCNGKKVGRNQEGGGGREYAKELSEQVEP